jgi:hypothetical protein
LIKVLMPRFLVYKPNADQRGSKEEMGKAKEVREVTWIKVVIDFLRVTAWPGVTIWTLVAYREVIRGLLPGSTVKLSISGVVVETTIPIIEKSVEESLDGNPLDSAQWNWLNLLHDAGLTILPADQVKAVRPLRNAGLIRSYPLGSYLAQAERGQEVKIGITTMGNLLVEAQRKSQNTVK